MASMPRFTVALARLQAVASPRLPAMAASTSVRSVVAGAAPRRALSAAAASPEAKMTALLREKLAATHVEVKDVSGGCGSFYTVTVVSPRFEGLSPIKQHRAVNEVLEADIGKMHGLTLKTLTPAAAASAGLVKPTA